MKKNHVEEIIVKETSSEILLQRLDQRFLSGSLSKTDFVLWKKVLETSSFEESTPASGLRAQRTLPRKRVKTK